MECWAQSQRTTVTSRTSTSSLVAMGTASPLWTSGFGFINWGRVCVQCCLKLLSFFQLWISWHKSRREKPSQGEAERIQTPKGRETPNLSFYIWSPPFQSFPENQIDILGCVICKTRLQCYEKKMKSNKHLAYYSLTFMSRYPPTRCAGRNGEGRYKNLAQQWEHGLSHF